MDSRPVEPKTAATVIDVTAGGDDVPVIRFDDHRRDSWMKDDSQDADSDELSALIGHYGRWQFFWTFLLALFQIPCTWQIFAYVFQVRATDTIVRAAPVEISRKRARALIEIVVQLRS